VFVLEREGYRQSPFLLVARYVRPSCSQYEEQQTVVVVVGDSVGEDCVDQRLDVHQTRDPHGAPGPEFIATRTSNIILHGGD
jgi:hypothetical protein